MGPRKNFSYYFGNIIPPSETDNGIDSIDLIKNFRTQFLTETTGHNNFFYYTVTFGIDGMLYGIEGLGLGGCDKTARVDDDNIGIIRLTDYQKSRLSDFSQHSLAVNDVFRAT